MAQNITLLGASYSDVPAVELPKTGGGTASFTDVTDTTATASDVAQGKYFYLADGTKTEGTSTGGGGGSVTQDQDGFIVLPPDGGGSPSVGGLEYESGTWTPSEQSNRPTIFFSNTHSEPPLIVRIADIGSAFTPSVNAVVHWSYFDSWKLTNGGTPSSSTNVSYAIVELAYVSTNGSAGGTRQFLPYNSSETGSSNNYPSYYVTSSAITPYALGSRYFLVGRTYKWIAVWAPTT